MNNDVRLFYHLVIIRLLRFHGFAFCEVKVLSQLVTILINQSILFDSSLFAAAICIFALSLLPARSLM